MRRRDFLRSVGAASCYLGLATDVSPAAARPLEIGFGPQLFLDDYLIERLDGLSREVQQPQRLAQPVLDSKTFGTTQPYLTVLRDRDRNRYRIWYNRGPALWHTESEDGLHWDRASLA